MAGLNMLVNTDNKTNVPGYGTSYIIQRVSYDLWSYLQISLMQKVSPSDFSV